MKPNITKAILFLMAQIIQLFRYFNDSSDEAGAVGPDAGYYLFCVEVATFFTFCFCGAFLYR
jgi:hypothetical protein